jgi:hypothetical protein
MIDDCSIPTYDIDPPPTKLRRLVASYWRMSPLNDAAGWRPITLGPPSSGSYLYSEQYSEDEASWQQRVLEWNTAVTKRTKYQADGIFIPMSTADLDRKPSPLRRFTPEEDVAMATTTTMGPSRRTTAAFEMLPLRPSENPVPLTTLRRIPGADSLSYSTDTVDTTTASEGFRRPLFRSSFNMLPPSRATAEREDEEDDELLIMDQDMLALPAATTPHLPLLASVTPSPHFFLHPPAPRLVRPTPRQASTHPRRAPLGAHAFRPVPPSSHRRQAGEPPPWQWTPVTSAFAPGRRPHAS